MKWKSLFIPILLALAGGALAAETPGTGPGNLLEADMVRIPAGNFLFGTDRHDTEGEALSMGIPKPWYIDETPQRKVFLKQFYIDRYEVTNRRYKNYVDDLGAIPPEDWKDKRYPEGRGDYPVVWVNWYDAANFCGWAGKQLPTEKQWERAARGTEGNLYPWGNTFNKNYANLADNPASKNSVTRVGSFPKGASPEGVYDLIGNVWEWTADDYKPYKGSAYNSPGFAAGYKVARGVSAMPLGHFPGPLYLKVLEKYARGGYREYLSPDGGAPDTGFRCVSSAPPKAMGRLAASFEPGQSAAGTPGTPSPSGEPPIDGSTADSGSPDLSFNPFEAKPNLPQSGILALILLSFAAGVFSFLSPCTLPILPAYFAVTAQADRARITLMSLAFFCGLATLFVIMGASASFLGQLLRDHLFQITTAGGILVIGFGLMTLAGKGFSGASFRNRPGSTFAGYFAFGATFALGWTPCVGPILSGILILAASDKTILQGMSLLFFYAVGLGCPLILISAFFGHLKKDNLFWRILRGKGWNFKIGNHTLVLHSTNLISGLLLIGLGVVLYSGYMTYINNIVPLDIQIWFSRYEEKFLHWFM